MTRPGKSCLAVVNTPSAEMLRLAQAPNLGIAQVWADALSQAGIAASVQRRFASAIAGQIPPDQALPEVWIDEGAQWARATEFLKAWREPEQRNWLCACGERVEGGFEACWACGLPAPTA
jgi:hypothetical protein